MCAFISHVLMSCHSTALVSAGTLYPAPAPAQVYASLPASDADAQQGQLNVQPRTISQPPQGAVYAMPSPTGTQQSPAMAASQQSTVYAYQPVVRLDPARLILSVGKALRH
jgi:hypothetical protein